MTQICTLVLENCYNAIKKSDISVLHGERAIFWAEKKNPLYEAYEQGAEEKGYRSAADFYSSHVNLWRMGNDRSEDYLSKINANHDDVKDFVRGQREKMDSEMDRLLRRRNKK